MTIRKRSPLEGEVVYEGKTLRATVQPMVDGVGPHADIEWKIPLDLVEQETARSMIEDLLAVHDRLVPLEWERLVREGRIPRLASQMIREDK